MGEKLFQVIILFFFIFGIRFRLRMVFKEVKEKKREVNFNYIKIKEIYRKWRGQQVGFKYFNSILEGKGKGLTFFKF